MNNKVINISNSIAGTYGQVFFSDNRLFAGFLLLASFVDPCIGLSGLICALFSLFLAFILGLNRTYVYNGSYSFNSLLTGLALGSFFKLTGNFVIILLFASALTLLITVWLSAFTSRHKLPFLSVPFILAVWIIFLNARSFDAQFLQIKNAGVCNGLWGESFSVLSKGIQSYIGSTLVLIYFKTMAAIFFQSQLLAGLLIAIGLLLYSRIAFLLSLVGFISGYLYFKLVQGNLSDGNYLFVAPSYVLSALGLGGFFLVPSGWSFLLVICTAPLVGLFSNSMDRFLFSQALPVYSLPFSVTVILTMSLLNNLYKQNVFHLVQVQQFNPEKNLYAYHNFMERFKKQTATIIHLPFFGEWTVSQGHEGDLTHKTDWRFAWDFVVQDEHKRTFKFPGKNVSDFYCYGLPVLAPADGQVIVAEDWIEDNGVGEVNLTQNWGNTIVIKHSDYLYSKLSHLKKGSFKIKVNDLVKKGEILALCGNSGRSPEPHLHFQLQSTGQVGAPTLEYPISYYGRKIYGDYQFNFFDIPAEGETVIKPVATPILKKAFQFSPGSTYRFAVHDQDQVHEETWEVCSDPFNNTYLKCLHSNAFAYFKTDDTFFYFTGFTGNKNCLLYYFYLGAHKILLSQFANLKISDQLSIEGLHTGPVKILQDFVAPFFIFLKPRYNCGLSDSADHLSITLLSKVRSNLAGRNINFEIEISDQRISKIKIMEKNKCTTAEII